MTIGQVYNESPRQRDILHKGLRRTHENWLHSDQKMDETQTIEPTQPLMKHITTKEPNKPI